ncbi:Cytochrome P450 [Trinorchestia longiramus]|nr:Cytochrome P450 [Trinorchestia longiramus]
MPTYSDSQRAQLYEYTREACIVDENIRYELRSNEVQDIYRLAKEFQKNFSILSFLPVLIPSLNKLPKCIKNVVFKENLFDQFLEEMRSVVEKTVDKHLEDYNPYNPRDLIDEYIKGMKESEGDIYSFFRKGGGCMDTGQVHVPY